MDWRLLFLNGTQQRRRCNWSCFCRPNFGHPGCQAWLRYMYSLIDRLQFNECFFPARVNQQLSSYQSQCSSSSSVHRDLVSTSVHWILTLNMNFLWMPCIGMKATMLTMLCLALKAQFQALHPLPPLTHVMLYTSMSAMWSIKQPPGRMQLVPNVRYNHLLSTCIAG